MKKVFAVIIAVVLLTGCMSVAAQGEMMIDVTRSVTKLMALRADGTINSHGYYLTDNSVLTSLTNVQQIAVEDSVENSMFALLEDGTVKEIAKYRKPDFDTVATWTEIAYIDGGNGFLAGLKADGTVVVSGSNAASYKEALSWTDIKTIHAKEDALIAITNSGTVLAAGVRLNDAEIAGWTNMKKVVYDSRCFWGITNDGEVISTESKYKYAFFAGKELVCDIADIELMSDFYSRVMLLKNDGTLYELESYSTRAGNYVLKEVQKDVAQVVTGANGYAAVLKDGEIYSDRVLLSSEAWILGIDIRVGGKYVDCDVAPYIKNDRTMVPIRAISEALGAEVGYDDATKTAIISKDGKVIKITMDSAMAYVDDAAVTLEAPAENVNSRIFVPVRFVSEGLDCNVDWVAETKSVIIN